MTKLRLRDLDPKTVAREVFESHFHATMRAVEATGFDASGLDAVGFTLEAVRARSPVYKAVLALAGYALTGEPAVDVWAIVGNLEHVIPRADLYQPEPTTPLAMAVAGAAARSRLESADHISVADLAVLTGLDRDHCIRLAGLEAIPGAYRSATNGHRPWMFRPNKSLRAWIAQYQTTEPQADRSPRHGTSRP